MQQGHAYFPVLFIFALFFTTANYLFASLHDPGVLPRPNADEVLQTEKENNIQTDLYEDTFCLIEEFIHVFFY